MARHIDKESVEKIAALAALDLSVDEKKHMLSELESVLRFIDRLRSVPIDGVASFDLQDTSIRMLRPDVVMPFSDRQSLLTKDRFKNNLLVTKGVFTASDDETRS